MLKLNIYTPYDTTIPGHYPTKILKFVLQKTYTTIFIMVLLRLGLD